MTKKHFNALAATIRRNLDETPNGKAFHHVCSLTEDMMGTFATLNPAFNFGTFRAACGYEIKNGKFRRL